jgi:hypothetical protein
LHKIERLQMLDKDVSQNTKDHWNWARSSYPMLIWKLIYWNGVHNFKFYSKVSTFPLSILWCSQGGDHP